jgi:hypothetical protein
MHLLTTGVVRGKVGDILVQGESGAQILVDMELVEHFEDTLTQVRVCKCAARVCNCVPVYCYYKCMCVQVCGACVQLCAVRVCNCVRCVCATVRCMCAMCACMYYCVGGCGKVVSEHQDT